MSLIPITGLLNFYMKKVFVISVASIAFLSLALSSCKNTLTPGIDQIVFPTSGVVSYEKYVQPLFNIACNYSGCHDAADAAGGLDLTDWITLTSTPGVVFKNDTTSGTLVQSIEGKLQHDPFLPGYLTPNQIQGLKAWVIQGAQNN